MTIMSKKILRHLKMEIKQIHSQKTIELLHKEKNHAAIT